MEKTGGDGEKGSRLGYKRHSSPRSWEGRTAEESTSLCKPPGDTNDQVARGSTQSPLNTPPLGLGPFSPPARLSPPLQNPPAPMEAGEAPEASSHHNSSIIWGNLPKLNRKTPLNRAGEKTLHPTPAGLGGTPSLTLR